MDLSYNMLSCSNVSSKQNNFQDIFEAMSQDYNMHTIASWLLTHLDSIILSKPLNWMYLTSCFASKATAVDIHINIIPSRCYSEHPQQPNIVCTCEAFRVIKSNRLSVFQWFQGLNVIKPMYLISNLLQKKQTSQLWETSLNHVISPLIFFQFHSEFVCTVLWAGYTQL